MADIGGPNVFGLVQFGLTNKSLVFGCIQTRRELGNSPPCCICCINYYFRYLKADQDSGKYDSKSFDVEKDFSS